MDAESLVFLVNFNSQAMGLNLEGITHEDSLVQPPQGNCINWLLGQAYHVGQMGLLRRIAGKERAIN